MFTEMSVDYKTKNKFINTINIYIIMGIFSRFFGTRKNEVSVAEPVLNDSEKLIADNETQKENSNLSPSTVVINYGTGMPIDVVYNFISKDFETIGYEDAMCNDDPSYKSSKILIIKNDLMRLFEQVSLKYKQDITELDVRIELMEQEGLINKAKSLNSKKNIFIEHINKINDMREALEKDEDYMTCMIKSYERGYRKALAAKTDQILKG